MMPTFSAALGYLLGVLLACAVVVIAEQRRDLAALRRRLRTLEQQADTDAYMLELQIEATRAAEEARDAYKQEAIDLGKRLHRAEAVWGRVSFVWPIDAKTWEN